MDATELPHSFQAALALFNALRCLGFESGHIFFNYNPRQGFIVSVDKGDGREFGIRAGEIDATYETWKTEWSKVTSAMLDGTLTPESLDKVWQKFDFMKVRLVEDLLRGGVQIPVLAKRTH